MDILEAMKERHSVRRYLDKSIEAEKRVALDALAAELNESSDVHIQIFYDEPTCFSGFRAKYGKFCGVTNYIALVGKKSDKLDETLGYCGERIVLKAQQLGLNTCWVALTHGKSKAVVGKGEKEVCLIALGYGASNGVAHKNKTLQEVSNCTDNSPEWFTNGVNAALLAPTAMNQQKFYFELRSDESVYVKCKIGFYAGVDLGIVKYHFEAATGKKVVD